MFDSIIGYEAVKRELEQISDALKNGGAYEKIGVKPPCGLLLYGEPGVGKSLMASAVIEASGLKAFTCRKDLPDGEFVNQIRKTFEAAREETPSIVFLDDMDKFANADEQHPDAEEYVTVQSCIDESRGCGVFVLATVNDISCLPRSLRRAGRFDRTIEVKNPDGRDAEKIIAHYIAGKKNVGEIDVKTLAHLMSGRSCAKLESVINEAGLYAGFERAPFITMEHMMKAVLHTVFDVPNEEIAGFGLEKEPGDDRVRVAYHEAGHAVIGEVLEPGSIDLVSVYAQEGEQAGFTHCRTSRELCVRDRLKHKIIRALGGPAAVEQVIGSFDPGCARDIDQAFDMVRDLVTENCISGFLLYSRGYADSPELRARQEQAAAAEVERYFREAKEILARNRAFLEEVAEGLLEKGLLTAAELAEIRKQTEFAAWEEAWK